MKISLIATLIILSSINVFSQFERVEIETDSTQIELVRNSVYRIWEETYKDKDSVFYSVRYIEDTAQLYIEGWKRKNGQYFGNWSEFKIDGTWLYTIDYSNHSWEYNKKEYKFQPLKDAMKGKADKLLIEKFGKEFFENNIAFNFYGHTYIGKWETYDSGTFWMQDQYLGSWIEPVKQIPNSFMLRYTIKLGNNEFYNDMLKVELDSTGNLIIEPSKFEVRVQEIVIPQKTKFTITKEKAIQIAKNNKLEDIEEIYQADLRFGWRKLAEYPGEFYYEVAQKYDEITEGDCKPNCTITRFFNVWRFNPWTSELIFKKPMKQISRWNRGCGVTGPYVELDK